MCVLFVSIWSKVSHRTFGCVTIGSVVFILRSRFLLYYMNVSPLERKLSLNV